MIVGNGGIECFPVVHEQGLVGGVVIRKRFAVKVAGKILHAGGGVGITGRHHQQPFFLCRVAIYADGRERRAFPYLADIALAAELAQQLPVFQVGGAVKLYFMLERHGYRHQPLLLVFQPYYAGVAEILFVDIHNGIAGVVGVSKTAVVAVRNELGFFLLFGLVCRIDGYDGRLAVPAEAAAVVRIQYRRS